MNNKINGCLLKCFNRAIDALAFTLSRVEKKTFVRNMYSAVRDVGACSILMALWNVNDKALLVVTGIYT